MPKLATIYPFLNAQLIEEIEQNSIIQVIPENTEILRIGQYVKVVPIVLDGLIKVFTNQEDKELLLYYIQPNESCIMSFSASMANEPSKVAAITEEATTALLLPIDQVKHWTKTFPDFNTLMYMQYNQRYSELLNTIHHVLFNKMDKRVLDYLYDKKDLTNKNPLKISHRQIANELGTAREVVSRVLKKLESEGHLDQEGGEIFLN